jgi:hypothetical protein
MKLRSESVRFCVRNVSSEWGARVGGGRWRQLFPPTRLRWPHRSHRSTKLHFTRSKCSAKPVIIRSRCPLTWYCHDIVRLCKCAKLPTDSATRAISSVPVTSSSVHWKNLEISFREQSTVSVTCASRWWTLHLGGVELPPLDPPRKRHGPPFSSPLCSDHKKRRRRITRKTFKKWEKRHLPGGIYLADIVLTEQKKKSGEKNIIINNPVMISSFLDDF